MIVHLAFEHILPLPPISVIGKPLKSTDPLLGQVVTAVIVPVTGFEGPEGRLVLQIPALQFPGLML